MSRLVRAGDVHGSATQVGGFIGSMFRTEVITRNSYATGDVEGGSRRGGFIGIVNSVVSSPSPRIEHSYFFGSINTGTRAFLGVDFEDSLTIVSSYWNSDLNDDDGSSQTSGLTEVEFSDPNQFSGWNFDQVWIMSDELGRPVLRWEVE